MLVENFVCFVASLRLYAPSRDAPSHSITACTEGQTRKNASTSNEASGVYEAPAQNGTYRFSGSNIGQQQLFEFHDATTAASLMLERFAGQTISYAELNDYALNESPFVNPKSMLKVLESRERIAVHTQHESRRRGTFPDHMHENIVVHFHGGDAHG